jgi:hypothetical protein
VLRSQNEEGISRSLRARANESDQRRVIPQNIPKFRCEIEAISDPDGFLYEPQKTLEADDLDLDQSWRRLVHLSLTRSGTGWAKKT